jgi:hypothetical protein
MGSGIRLLLDARVVDVRLSNLMLVTLSSLRPFFGNGLKKAWHFSGNVGTEDSGLQEERSRILEWLASRHFYETCHGR